MEVINPIVRRLTREAAEDPEGFWARADEKLPWFRGVEIVNNDRYSYGGSLLGGGHAGLGHCQYGDREPKPRDKEEVAP